MSYRFVKITTFYKEYLNHYYYKHGDMIYESYKVQFDHIMYDSFAWADFYQRNLRKIGVEAYEIIYNADPLQKAWAKENGSNKAGRDLLTYQIQSIKPDVVFIQDTNLFNGEWIDYLREMVPSINLVIGWCCSPFSSKQLDLDKKFDFMVTCSPLFDHQFKNYGLKSFQLKHAFEAEILNRIKSLKQEQGTDLLFSGSFKQGVDFHNERISMIEDVINSGINLKLFSELQIDKPLLLLSKQFAYLFSKLFMSLGLESIIEKNIILKKVLNLNEFPRNPKFSEKFLKINSHPVFGLEMFKTLADAKVSLNIHGGIAGDYAANLRLFEATGAGSCLVTDWKKNLDEIFEIDKEVVAFKSTEECIEKVKWLLEHPTERLRIRDAAQRRVLKDHTFEIRAQQLDEIIRKELAYN